ncbi:MAG: long-chain acyl-CoA synthetase [Gaiellaceae bacterium]|nr:long-chain acyl-CoA synthetase [Gaiellaceae bacterium]
MLSGLLDGPARWCSDGRAIVVGDRTVHTWRTFAEAVARRSAALRASCGAAPGDSVMLFAPNCPEYLEILFSIWHAGAVAVPVDGRLHPREAAELMARSGARICFAAPELSEGLSSQLPEGSRIVVIGGPDDRALARAEPAEPVARSLADDAWIFFTSGTTGRAKGARISHGNLLAMTAAYYADVDSVGPLDSFVHVASLSHASGLFSLPFVARGAAQVLPESLRFDVGELLSLVAAGERTTFFVPPTLLRRLCADHRSSTPVRRIGRVLVGAAPVAPDDLRRGIATFGPCLWNGYGQGETPCTITALAAEGIAAAIDEGDDRRLASVGVARFATRVRIVDAADGAVPPGEVGEVVVAGPTVMAGYLDQPEETMQVLRGGWLHTGDLGRFDERGHLTLVDRVKDVVITGGSNVYPSEVEHVLLADPAVAEAAVVGVPDAEWGERLVAFVVAGGGAEVDPAALEARCLEEMARYKRPREYRVVAELPRNNAGKVLKSELRRMHLAEEQHVAG